MQKIIINGANGYVASYFIKELLSMNYEVVALARNSNTISAEQRMRNVLKKISGQQVLNLNNLKVYSYSLLTKNYGLSEEQLRKIFEGEIDFFHFAASLKYHIRDKEEIMATNVGGLENTLDVFLKYASPASRFFFISTVYSCGKTSVPVKEIFFDDNGIDRFRNYYEQSKRIAENRIRMYIEKEQLKAHILRLSQVIGDNITGITTTDYGIFDFAKRVYNFSEKYSGETVRIKINPEGSQNLIAIDNVVNYLISSTTINDLPTIIHLAGKKSIKNDNIIKSICSLIPINIIQDKTREKKDMNPLERMIATSISFTGSYADIDLKFEIRNLDKLNVKNCNEVNIKSLHQMLEYYINLQKKSLL